MLGFPDDVTENDVNRQLTRRFMAVYKVHVLTELRYMSPAAMSHVKIIYMKHPVPAEPVPDWPVIQDRLQHMTSSCTTEDMFDFLVRFVLPDPLTYPQHGPATCLTYCHRERLRTHLMPTTAKLPTCLNVPPISRLYGYPAGPAAAARGGYGCSAEYSYTPFSPRQIETLKWRVHPDIPQFVLATELTGVCLPFLAVEAYSTQQLFWRVENQLAVAAAACLRAVCQLNAAVSQRDALANGPAPKTQSRELPLVDPWIYCVAANPLQITVHGVWMQIDPATISTRHPGAPQEKTDVCMLRVRKFSMSNALEFNTAKTYISAILDWGKERFEQIRLALDFLDGATPPSESTSQKQ